MASKASRSKLKDFAFLGKVGKGSFGEVFRVRRKSDQAIYVIKQINMARLKPKQQEAAINEVRVMSQLNNPHIIKYHDSFFEDNKLNIVMQYAERGNLSEYLKRQSTPPKESTIWRMFLQIATGVHYMHRKVILHRDIKALNVFMDAQENCKLGDFGVAKKMQSENAFANSPRVGTPYYLSPEMCQKKPYNDRADVWALGCLLYELCTLQHPFRGQSEADLLPKIVKGKYLPIAGSFSSDLTGLVSACLTKDTQHRPSISALLSMPCVLQKMKDLGMSSQQRVGASLAVDTGVAAAASGGGSSSSGAGVVASPSKRKQAADSRKNGGKTGAGAAVAGAGGAVAAAAAAGGGGGGGGGGRSRSAEPIGKMNKGGAGGGGARDMTTPSKAQSRGRPSVIPPSSSQSRQQNINPAHHSHNNINNGSSTGTAGVGNAEGAGGPGGAVGSEGQVQQGGASTRADPGSNKGPYPAAAGPGAFRRPLLPSSQQADSAGGGGGQEQQQQQGGGSSGLGGGSGSSKALLQQQSSHSLFVPYIPQSALPDFLNSNPEPLMSSVLKRKQPPPPRIPSTTALVPPQAAVQGGGGGGGGEQQQEKQRWNRDQRANLFPQPGDLYEPPPPVPAPVVGPSSSRSVCPTSASRPAVQSALQQQPSSRPVSAAQSRQHQQQGQQGSTAVQAGQSTSRPSSAIGGGQGSSGRGGGAGGGKKSRPTSAQIVTHGGSVNAAGDGGGGGGEGGDSSVSGVDMSAYDAEMRSMGVLLEEDEDEGVGVGVDETFDGLKPIKPWYNNNNNNNGGRQQQQQQQNGGAASGPSSRHRGSGGRHTSTAAGSSSADGTKRSRSSNAVQRLVGGSAATGSAPGKSQQQPNYLRGTHIHQGGYDNAGDYSQIYSDAMLQKDATDSMALQGDSGIKHAFAGHSASASSVGLGIGYSQGNPPSPEAPRSLLHKPGSRDFRAPIAQASMASLLSHDAWNELNRYLHIPAVPAPKEGLGRTPDKGTKSVPYQAPGLVSQSPPNPDSNFSPAPAAATATAPPALKGGSLGSLVQQSAARSPSIRHNQAEAKEAKASAAAGAAPPGGGMVPGTTGAGGGSSSRGRPSGAGAAFTSRPKQLVGGTGGFGGMASVGISGGLGQAGGGLGGGQQPTGGGGRSVRMSERLNPPAAAAGGGGGGGGIGRAVRPSSARLPADHNHGNNGGGLSGEGNHRPTTAGHGPVKSALRSSSSAAARPSSAPGQRSGSAQREDGGNGLDFERAQRQFQRQQQQAAAANATNGTTRGGGGFRAGAAAAPDDPFAAAGGPGQQQPLRGLGHSNSGGQMKMGQARAASGSLAGGVGPSSAGGGAGRPSSARMASRSRPSSAAPERQVVGTAGQQQQGRQRPSSAHHGGGGGGGGGRVQRQDDVPSEQGVARSKLAQANGAGGGGSRPASANVNGRKENAFGQWAAPDSFRAKTQMQDARRDRMDVASLPNF